jgi:hypothetical protein
MQIQNPLLTKYLSYVEQTAAPRIFHVWSAMLGVSACLGRKVYFDFDIEHIYPNIYAILVGPPAVKKSSSFNLMGKLLRRGTKVRFAPKDTAGQRQGLMAAIANQLDTEEIKNDLLDSISESARNAAFNLSGNQEIDMLSAIGNINIDLRDPHSMFVLASEFTSFTGINNFEMLTFLLEMWDGASYDYRLRNTAIVIKDPLLSMIAGATPTNLSECLPKSAIGQGFMSRIILVYANRQHPAPFMPKLKKELEDDLIRAYSHIFNDLAGEIKMTSEALTLFEKYGNHSHVPADPRFVYYSERRFAHLLKLAMCLAASSERKDFRIDAIDVEEAHTILAFTEKDMPDALGEYGLSPLAHAKQRLFEFINLSTEPLDIISSGW